jgi:CHAD domain-containing protein
VRGNLLLRGFPHSPLPTPHSPLPTPHSALRIPNFALAFPALLPPASLPRLAKSLRKQWKRSRQQLKRCQAKFSPKAIHDSRVAARRLLALVELLSGFISPADLKKVQRAVKCQLDTFDDLRDTQVQLEIVGRMRRSFPAARTFAAWLAQRETRFTSRTRKRIKKVKPRRFAKLLAAARKQVAAQLARRPAQEALGRLLDSVNRAFNRTCQLQRRINPRATQSIHRTRIAFKKFRYMVETLAEYSPVSNQELLAEMHHYQTMMGDVQDTEVLLQTFDKYLRKGKADPEAAGRLRAELLRRRQWLVQVYLDASAQLLEFWSL